MDEQIWAWSSICIGLVVLVGGGELLVRGASRLAIAARISPLVIGLTVVAFGTSAPELAVSVQAALAGSADLAIGNVVGSNIFNVLFILGLSALIVLLVVSSQLVRWDVPVMIAVAAACLPIFFTGHMISRWEGALFFFYYLAYMAYIVLNATSNGLSHTMRDVMLMFIIPLTVVTLAVTAWRSFRQQRSIHGA